MTTQVNAVALVMYVALLGVAALSDMRRYTLPNIIVLATLLAGVAVLATAPGGADWAGAILVGATVLGAGFFLSLARVFGAGDAKLFAVVAAVAGPKLLILLGFVVALVGLLLALVLILRGMWRGQPRSEIRRIQVPYGVAIAAGGIVTALLPGFG